MKILLLLLLFIDPINDLDKIARINAAKKEAERAYLADNYKLASEKYLYLKDSLGVNDDKLLLNLANSQFLSNDSTSAQQAYNKLRDSPSRAIASLAEQQLGAMQFKGKKYQEALQHYKASLKSDPSNEESRYNYELLKKLIKEQEEKQEQQQDQQNQDQENQDQENKDQEKQEQEKQDQEKQEQENKDQENKDQEKQEEQDQEQKENQEEQKQQEEQKPEDQEKKEDEEQSKPNPIDEEKLKEMNISEEKAMLILEAMKNNEIQYIQQNKRKAKKKKDPSKPDW